MAIPTIFPVPGKTTALASLAASGTSAEVPVGINGLVRIVSNQGVNVRFGPAGTNAASAADLYIPANNPQIFDLAEQYASLCFFNSSAAAALIWITTLSRN